MWGVIPAAGNGSRIQPLAFSKELLPLGGGELDDRPRAVSEYLIERLIEGGADKICFVISPGKSDILQYYGGHIGRTDIAYVVQPHPAGLCDAIFRAHPLVHPDEPVAIGLPDTVWFPAAALRSLPDGPLAFLLFPVSRPELFDVVVTDERGRVTEIQVKPVRARSNWIWGAFRMSGATFHELHALWSAREPHDLYVGTLVNAWIRAGGEAVGVCAGERYVDVGTLHGYREAMRLIGPGGRHGRAAGYA
jgi:glucose-1-phosphate thymidylyltransferase